VLQDTTAIEGERREAVQLAAELRMAMAVATALVVAAPRTADAVAATLRAPLNGWLPSCHMGIGWRPSGEEDPRALVINELPDMAAFDRAPKRTTHIGRVLASGQTYVNNDLGPVDIVGPRAIGTDPVPARSAMVLPLFGERELGVLTIYHQKPHFFGAPRVSALEALAPALAASLDRIDRGASAAA
jgi:GAF domain-containing protein